MTDPALRQNTEVAWRAITRIFVPQLVLHARERMTVAYGGEEGAVRRLRSVVGAEIDKAVANAARRQDAMRRDEAPPRDAFSYLDLALCRSLYEAEFETLLSDGTVSRRDEKRLRRECVDTLQRILGMRNRLAHESGGLDLSYDDAESVLNPLTRLLERLGYPEAATSSRIVRSELVGSPRSVRGVVTDSNRGWVRPARRVWFTAAAVVGIATLGALVVLWSLRRNDGGDPSRPLLPQTDADFVDTRGGWGWGDKCWTHLKAGKLGWAKAECDEGMKMQPAAPQPRASLLYNEGLLAQAAGSIDEARRDFTESLLLRENQEVRQALTSLPAR